VQAVFFLLTYPTKKSTMLKRSLFVLWLVAASAASAQTGAYIQGETRVEGLPGFLAKTMNMTMKMWQAKNKSLAEIKRQSGTQYLLTVDDQVTLADGKDCYTDTKQQIAGYHDDDFTIEDLQVTKTAQTKTLLGYPCRHATITYNVRAQGVVSAMAAQVWYSSAISMEGLDPAAGMYTPDLENDYSRALRELGGFVLGTEQLMKSSGMTTIFSVTRFEKQDIPDATFKIDTGKCKKMMTYKEFKEEMRRREIRDKAGFR
jgi:hypothetical protein